MGDGARHRLLTFRCFATCNASLDAVRVRKMSHQHIRLAILLSGSGHDCVDLSPIENCNFGWGSNLTESPSFFVLTLYDLKRKITCCCDGTLRQQVRPQNIRLHRVLSASGQHDLSPMKNYNFGWGPNFLKTPSSLVPMFHDFQRKLTCCPDTKMPHQNSRLDILFFDSGQSCVDLSPIENYFFRWGPNFIESPSSFMFQTF